MHGASGCVLISKRPTHWNWWWLIKSSTESTRRRLGIYYARNHHIFSYVEQGVSSKIPRKSVLRVSNGSRLVDFHHFKNHHGTFKFPQQVSMSSKASSEDVGEGSESLSLGDLEFDAEITVDASTEDELNSQYITNLYRESKDSCLSQLISANSIEQVFNTFESIPAEAMSPEHSSQALVMLWDLQKFFFRIESYFDPERDFSNRSFYIQQLSHHPTFQRILQHVIAHIKLLNDEPLAACLLTLKKLDYSVRSPECQVLVDECLQRKSTLHLTAVSRLYVVMKLEGIYGSLIAVELFPRLSQLIAEMDNSQSLRLISIALRSMNRCIPSSIITLYRDRLADLLDSKQIQSSDEGSTFCKILLTLGDTRWIQDDKNHKSTAQTLQRRIGHLLIPKVKDLDIMDVLSLQRFMEYGAHEPPEFIEALNQRISRLIEEQEDPPRLDLISCFSPSIGRSIEQRKRLASYIHYYLDKYPKFDQIFQLLLKALRIAKVSDQSLYENFWNKALQFITIESHEPRKVVKLSYDYLSFGLVQSYRHIQFETKMKQLLYFYLFNYEKQQQPTFISPSDFSRAFAFLIGFGWHSEPIFQEASHGLLDLFEKKFARQSRPLEMCAIARGISVSLSYQGNNPRSPVKYFDQITNFSALLLNTIHHKLEENNDLDITELFNLIKIQLLLKRASSESETFNKTITTFAKITNQDVFDSKQGRDIALALVTVSYNDPAVTRIFQKFILANPQNISIEFVEKFLMYAYNFGLEPQSPEEVTVFQHCHNVVERYWEMFGSLGLVQSCLSLSLFQTLQLPLVQKIFSIEFLNRVDEEIKYSSNNSSFPFKIRKAYMELNRAVCLDLPAANVPWFHQKFCESFYSTRSIQETPIEHEVYTSLTEIMSDSTAIQRNVFTPYFYFLNYLIEFDKSGKPIKKMKPRKLLSLHNLRSSNDSSIEVGERVGIFIAPVNAYTLNFRSLKGYYLLRKRHLEILGYRIIHIHPQHWNSMYMSEPHAKSDYLESIIFDKKHETGKEIPVHLDLV